MSDVLINLSTRLTSVSWHDNGRYFSCACAFHNDSKPSMMVYEDGYRCLACGAHGSVDFLLRKITGTKPVAVPKDRRLPGPNWSMWLQKYGSYEELVNQANATAMSSPFLVTYLVKRGVYEAVVKGKVGYLDGWIVFPVYDKVGRLIDLVVNPTPNKQTESKYYLRPRNYPGEQNLYSPSWEDVSYGEFVVVPFGIYDVWSISLAGYPAITPMGGQFSLKASQLDEIRKPILFFPDYGETESATKLASQLGWRGRVVDFSYSEKEKDPNDIHTVHGLEKLKEIIEEAVHGRQLARC